MQEDHRQRSRHNNNNVKSGWERILPSTDYEAHLKSLGLFMMAWTGREVYEASKTYGRNIIQIVLNAKAVYCTLPWVNGCKCQGAGWYMFTCRPSRLSAWRITTM
jgi:hypothetical protein